MAVHFNQNRRAGIEIPLELYLFSIKHINLSHVFNAPLLSYEKILIIGR